MRGRQSDLSSEIAVLVPLRKVLWKRDSELKHRLAQAHRRVAEDPTKHEKQRIFGDFRGLGGHRVRNYRGGISTYRLRHPTCPRIHHPLCDVSVEVVGRLKIAWISTAMGRDTASDAQGGCRSA